MEPAYTRDPAGARLEAAREAAHYSLSDAAYAVRHALGPRLAVTGQQIRNYELGRTDVTKWNPLVIRVLADRYNVPLETISPIIAAAWAETGPRLTLLVTPEPVPIPEKRHRRYVRPYLTRR